MKRMIDTNIWEDAKVEELTPMAKLMWVYVLTSPRGNLAGCFELTIRRISIDTGMQAAQARKAIDELRAASLVAYDEQTSELLILQWGKHNWSKSPKLEKPLTEAIRDVKSDGFRSYLAAMYSNRLGKPYPYNIDTVSEHENTVFANNENPQEKYPIDTVSIDNAYDSISISITNSNAKETESAVGDKSDPPKHRRGEYGNVLLTDDEMAKLKERFPTDWEQRIRNLDEYIGYKGAKYKSHYLTIISWANRDAKRDSPKTYEEVSRERGFDIYNR